MYNHSSHRCFSNAQHVILFLIFPPSLAWTAIDSIEQTYLCMLQCIRG